MPRRKVVIKRQVLPDPKFKSRLVTMFINRLMSRGKKSTAENIFYKALNIIQDKTHKEPLALFEQAVTNVKPSLEVKSRRVGGATYQVPVEVRYNRRNSLAIRWLINYAYQRKEKTMQERLAAELLDAANNRGTTIKKKEDTHKMAEANRAFAHYRW